MTSSGWEEWRISENVFIRWREVLYEGDAAFVSCFTFQMTVTVKTDWKGGAQDRMFEC